LYKESKYCKKQKTRVNNGITAGVLIIMVMYNLTLNTHSNDRIEKNRTTHNTIENIQRNWLSPQIDLSRDYPEGFFLFKYLTPDADHGAYEPTLYDPKKRIQIEIVTSIGIWQAMIDFLTLGSDDATGKNIWVNNILIWLQSPIFKKNWKVLSFNYSKDTRVLIDRLIAESEKLALIGKKKGKLTKNDCDDVSDNFSVIFRWLTFVNTFYNNS
jgi:hypothetical protein